jgi:hypothetical protein
MSKKIEIDSVSLIQFVETEGLKGLFCEKLIEKNCEKNCKLFIVKLTSFVDVNHENEVNMIKCSEGALPERYGHPRDVSRNFLRRQLGF